MSKCYNCLFHIVDNDMGAILDCCLLKDTMAEAVRACDNSENCKKRLTLGEAKKIVEEREEDAKDLYNADYRKASEVAREIQQDIIEPLWEAWKDNDSQSTVFLVAMLLETITYRLKKKYTKETKEEGK